jgi:hypothetical protein
MPSGSDDPFCIFAPCYNTGMMKGQILMSEPKLNLDRDLKEAGDMAAGLADYLRGDQVYGSIGGMFGSGNQPALTVGALLLRLRRLHALQDKLTDAQRAQLAAVEAQHEAVRREWSVHYEEKLLREANSRLDAMRAYFEECSQSPRQCANSYLPEAARRTIVQELVIAMDALNVASEDLNRKARDTDGKLRRYVQASDFVWAQELATVYPRADFWWLYMRPPQPS